MERSRKCYPVGSLVFLFFLGLASFATGVAPAKSGNKVKPGEFIVGDPTLICLGFEWSIEGDDNRNATVAVQYRKKGTASWKEGLPLLRLQNEEAGGSLTPGSVVPNMFAGSIFDLEPDTEYECRFQMSDPDGVDGNKQKTVTVRTRPEPKPFAGGRVFHAYPASAYNLVGLFFHRLLAWDMDLFCLLWLFDDVDCLLQNPFSFFFFFFLFLEDPFLIA